MSAILIRDDIPVEIAVLRGSPPETDDLDPAEAFWKFMEGCLEHEEDV